LGWRIGLTETAIMLYNDKQRKEAEEAVHRMVKRAVEMEGTVTGEHGVGLVKRDYLNHELGETTVDAMRKVGSNTNSLVEFCANDV
jgi:FAD/FMN-containing dehydrogenase